MVNFPRTSECHRTAETALFAKAIFQLFKKTIRRAGVSVPSNIGEGKRRKRQKALAHHLDIALGSQGELEVQLEIAKRVGFLAEKDYVRLLAQVEEVGRMLNGLIASIGSARLLATTYQLPPGSREFFVL